MYTWIYGPYGMKWYEQGENLTLFSCMNTIQVDTIVTDLLGGRQYYKTKWHIPVICVAICRKRASTMIY